MVGGRIEALRRLGEPLAEMAILVRAGFQTRAFEERLIALGVPYRVIGGQRFYKRQEIRDVIAYMRLTAQPADDLAFERIVNVPRRGVGEVALRTIHDAARLDRVPLTEAAAKLVASAALKGRVKEQLDELLRGFVRWRELLVREGHVITVATMLDESGYTDMWQRDKSPEAPGRLENLKELVRAMADFETLSGFLDHISLVMENDEAAEGDRVSLMILHAAKGLEFDTVFLRGWEEGLFPNQRALHEGGVKSLEEERRLAYVGLTSARRRAIISHAANRQIYASWQSSIPSRFIEELPEADIEETGSAALARVLSATTFTGQFALMARRARTIEVWEQPERPSRIDAIFVGTRVFTRSTATGPSRRPNKTDWMSRSIRRARSACSIGSWRRCEGGPRPNWWRP